MTETLPLQARLTGATRLLGIVGDPIDQVRSPETFNPRIAQADRNTVLVPIHIRAADFDETIDAVMKIANLDGLVLTMPFKERILSRLGTICDRARHVGAANAARRSHDGSWIGDMFDGVGLLGAVRSLGIDPAGLRVGLVGAGGAGSAIAFALAETGVASLAITDLDRSRAAGLAQRIAAAGLVVPSAAAFAVEDVDLLINATPVGMSAGDGPPLDVDRLAASTGVVDIVTKPATTPLLAAAAKAGCRHVGGAAMVAAQTAAMLEFFGLTAKGP